MNYFATNTYQCNWLPREYAHNQIRKFCRKIRNRNCKGRNRDSTWLSGNIWKYFQCLYSKRFSTWVEFRLKFTEFYEHFTLCTTWLTLITFHWPPSFHWLQIFVILSLWIVVAHSVVKTIVRKATKTQ